MPRKKVKKADPSDQPASKNEDEANSQAPVSTTRAQTRKREAKKSADDATLADVPSTKNSKKAEVKKADDDFSNGKGEEKDGKSDKNKKTKAKNEANAENGGKTMKTFIIKGSINVPVDSECPAKDRKHVFCEGNDIYDCTLNQTNVGDNNNKYYIIQLLEDDNTSHYSVWQRWGRVGFKGQSNLVPCSDLDGAKKVFCKKFVEKTKNEWSNRHEFKKFAGKYDLIEVEYSKSSKKGEKGEDQSENEESGDVAPKKKVECSLEMRVQELLTLICDVKAMETAVKEMKYDADKAPLGKLTYGQVKAGYEALKKIETLINQGKTSGRELIEACSEFYTRIPHSFGMKVPPLITDAVALKQKIDLLETLADIEIAMRVLKSETADQNLHPLDRHYLAMNCRLESLDPASEEFLMIEKYLQNTHTATHTAYKTKLLNVFVCEKNGENDKFMKDLGNRMLLWHGSRLTNWYGILSQGLRIAPPEAPVTGYMFGKGVYFADCSSKSTNYCFATKKKNVGLAVLSEVALGKTNDLYDADYHADKLTAGHHSTKGLGRVAPDPKDNIEKDGCVIPLGCPIDAPGSKDGRRYSLNYNEYIVYNTQQIKMKYLLKIEFVFS